MRACRLLLLSVMALLVVAPAASASQGCVAPDGTAATDQYCEFLATAEGPTDATGSGTRPLASVLSKRAIKRLERAGVLGQVLLALPAGSGAHPEDTSAAMRTAVRRADVDPRHDALLPGPGPGAGSLVRAAGSMNGQVEQGFAWTLVLTLLALAGLSMWGSLRTRSVG
jgi:hypothetical protein